MEQLDMAGNPAIEFAGGWLGVGFVTAVAGLIAGAVLLGYGWAKRKQRRKEAGAALLVASLFGALLLGNVNGGIQWGTSKDHTMALMPKGAQKQEITVEKKPPLSTCSEPIKYAHSWQQDEKSKENRRKANELWPKLVSDDDAAKHPEVQGLEYTPQGPDCSKNSTTAQTCTNVTVWVAKEDSKPMRPGDQIPDAMDPDKFEYPAQGSKDC